MATKENLIRLMLMSIFILTVCFYFGIDYYHQGLPFETISEEVLDIPLDFLDDS